MKDFQHTHPVTIFFNLGRVLYLILIPALRGIVSAFRGGFYGWLSGAWLDLLVFLLMVLIAVVIWYAVIFRYDGEEIEVRSGIISRHSTVILWYRVTTVTLLEKFYLRPFRALLFRVDTLGGGLKNSDLSILLTKKQANRIIGSYRASTDETLGRIYQPATGSVIALSLLTSNSFGGILFMSAFISQSGKLVGREFSEMLLGTFEEATRRLAFGIPPAAAATAYILLAGWFIGFLLSFTRYKNFTLTHRKNTLSINGGIFTRREYYIRYGDVNFIDIRQSLVTKILRLFSLYLSAVGYGKHKDDISCIIPTESEKQFELSLQKILPAFSPTERVLAPNSRGIARFLGEPVSCIAAITATLTLFLRLFPSWSGFIWFVGLMTYLPTLFFLFIRVIDFRTCGLSFSDNYYTIRYSQGLYLHTVVIPVDKLVCIELRQGFFQKFGPYCDVIVSAKAEGRSHHRCRSLIKADVMKMFDLL